MTIREHYQGVQDLIPGDINVHLGSPPESPEYPYVVLWGNLGESTTEALSDVPDELDLNIRATVAGESFESVCIVLERVRAALNRAAPTVPGWYPQRMVQSSLVDVQTDYDITIPGTMNHPLYAVDEYSLRSTRT